MNKNYKIGFLVAWFFIALLSACEPKINPADAENYGLSVVSLKDALPLADELAQKWQNDAYPISISIPIGEKASLPYLIIIGYGSSNAGFNELAVVQDIGGEFSASVQSPGNTQKSEAIGDTDWKLDSPEILRKALDDKLIRDFLKQIDKEDLCGGLILRRNHNLPQSPIVWRVYIHSCMIPSNSISVFIDPISGEEIEQP